jgi:two-component system sensor histidine kinase/response regulator
MELETAHLLIVDDNEVNLDVLSRRLIRSGFTVDLATNGRDALDMIEKNNYSLVLLDIIMPEISGVDVLKKIREKYSLRSLPVIMVSAKDESEDIIECLEYGANDYVTKPINYPIVLARLKGQIAIKRAEESQEHLLKELHKLNDDKDKFFSIISHDLRSPLTPIIGTAEYIKMYFDKLNKDEIISAVEDINTAAENISNLLESLLQWSGLQIGRIKYQPQPIELILLVNQTIEILKANAVKKEINLINRIDDNIVAYCDHHMIYAVLRNLISNAIKFTNPGGSITINSKQIDKHLEVSVTDTGIGINKESIDKLFRIDTVYTTRGTSQEKGTGLGLILCKELIEKNGGKIWVESEIGKGTTFKFTLHIPME